MREAITDHLRRPAGSREAAQARWRILAPLVDRELRRVAASMIANYVGSGEAHSIEPGELVNELYVRLLAGAERQWQNRGHFLAYAAAVMRAVLIDRHRTKLAQKRPPPALRESLSAVRQHPQGPDTTPIIELRLAMQRLDALSPRQAAIVQWKCFEGMTLEAIAGRLQLSEKTVRRDWMAARAFLLAELGGTSTVQE